LLRGMLIPEIRAIRAVLALPLFMPWVLTDHQNGTVATDDLALLAHGFDRGSDLHGSVDLPSV
jgi:hypothetical protein